LIALYKLDHLIDLTKNSFQETVCETMSEALLLKFFTLKQLLPLTEGSVPLDYKLTPKTEAGQKSLVQTLRAEYLAICRAFDMRPQSIQFFVEYYPCFRTASLTVKLDAPPSVHNFKQIGDTFDAVIAQHPHLKPFLPQTSVLADSMYAGVEKMIEDALGKLVRLDFRQFHKWILDYSDFPLFPTTIDAARKMAKAWEDYFHAMRGDLTFQGYGASIFFDIKTKRVTIRLKLRSDLVPTAFNRPQPVFKSTPFVFPTYQPPMPAYAPPMPACYPP